METDTPHTLETLEAHHPSSKWTHHDLGTPYGRCCCCLLSLVLLSLTILTAAILFIIFVIRPKKPMFHLHSIHLDSFKLEAASGKEIYVTSPMASLLFVTQNPNKLGIRYSPSELGVLYEGVPVGVVDVPSFYQPPCNRNVTVLMHVSLVTLNVTRFINGGTFSSNDTRVEIKIIGGIRIQPHILNFPLPRIKVSLDCRINMNYGAVTLSKGVDFIKAHEALVLSHFPHLSQKCSLALRV